jgi:hypothetical protein
LIKQTIQLSGDRFADATLAALLPRIGNGERENVPTKRSRRMLPELLDPERPQFATGQPIEAMNIGRGVASAIVRSASACIDHSRSCDHRLVLAIRRRVG